MHAVVCGCDLYDVCVCDSVVNVHSPGYYVIEDVHVTTGSLWLYCVIVVECIRVAIV